MKQIFSFNFLQNAFTTLVGKPGEATLESRIFNSVCLVGIIAVIYNIPFNYYIGLTEASFVSLLLFIVLGFIYYLSRVKNKFYISVTMMGSVVSLLLALNYFFNAGAVGSSLLLFMFFYSLLSIVTPSRQFPFWFFFNLFLVLSLLTTEYLYPESIVKGYSNRLNQLVDVASTYIVGIVLIYLSTYFFKKAYRSERRLVEEKSLELSRLNEEQNKLFSIMSHDLRSPLASVQQYLEIIRETDLDETQKRKMEAGLLDVVSHTQEMLSNLLSWSTTQMNGMNVNRTQVNLYTILKPILDIYKPLTDKKYVRLEYRISPNINVLADSNMLQLIVRNLVGNAIKFTPSGGVVTLEVAPSGSECQIIVKDTGIGIDPANKEAIFSLKSRSTFGTNHEKGVGLGLFLCKQYAEAQQGKLWFESEPGVGTTFFFSLPVLD